MPRRHKQRTMKGGFLDSLTQDFNNAWEKTKKATSNAYSYVTGSTSNTYSIPSLIPSTQNSSSGYMGGKTKRRRMRGGFKDNNPTTGLASHAAPFSGSTAQPHNWVGGRTRRRGRKYSRRHRR